jgi:anti-anti-sigma regulatory factor
MLALGKKLKASGTELVVCSANPTNKSVFKMSGFTRIFSIFDTEEEALQLT